MFGFFKFNYYNEKMFKKIMKNSLSPANRKDHLANERTFLAWIRTCIGIMALGFVVEKFSFFIKQIGYLLGAQGITHNKLLDERQGSTYLFGIFLIAMGALIGLISYINYRKTEKQIEENTKYPTSFLSILVTLLVVLLGIFLVMYLISA